jgi:hypothetical protein
MLGSITSLQATSRWRLIVAAIAATIGLAALAPAARASGCTDSWTNTAGGSWYTGTNWSKEAPPGPGEEACIAASGTYTVTMTQESGTVSLAALTVGGTSGTQTLLVGSSCSVNAILATTAGLGVGAHGAVTLTNGDGCGDSVTLTGPVTNAGTITSEPASGGARSLQGNITSTGTLAINTNTSFNGSSTTLTNEGPLDVAAGEELAVSSKNTFVNGTGGSIVAAGAGGVVLSGATFTQGAGTTSGTKPVIDDDGALKYTGGGKSFIALRGTSTLSGNLDAVQSISIESTCSENTTVTASKAFSSAGTITLTNGDGCGDNATLAISEGTLTNTGKLITEPASGGGRTLQGSIKNTGVISIKANTAYNGTGATLTNEGALNLAEGTQLTVSAEGTLVNGTGGSIAASGGANVTMDSGTFFTAGAGTTSGVKPVIVDDSTLTYTGGGSGLIALRGSSKLSGSLGAEQTLSIESTCSENVTATAAASFTNAGTMKLTNADGCGDNATLTISEGTLTNTGKLITEHAAGGARTVQGNLTNTGTLSFNVSTAYSGASGTLTNEGALDVAEGNQLNVSGNNAVVNGAGGNITAPNGAYVSMLSGATFTEGAGTTTGVKPVIVDDGTLTYTGAGASTIALHGTSTLNGSLGAEQTLSIESTCSENGLAEVPTSATNGGTIKLTNGDGCGNNATLDVETGTLTNSGKIVTEPAAGGARTLAGNLTNTGTITTKANTAYTGSGELLTNSGTIDVAEGTQLSVTGGSVTNASAGNIFAPGSALFYQVGGTFTEASGKTSGTVPVILDDASLKYESTSAEPGSGPIAMRGASTVSGRVRTGNTLILQSTCSENASITDASSLESFGLIEMTNGDGCGDDVTLTLKEGIGTLTNGGTLSILEPHGGSRTIAGNLVNKATVSLAAAAHLQVNGAYTQTSAGQLRSFIGSASEFGSMTVSGVATIAGLASPRKVGTFKPTLGQSFAILNAASLSGTFSGEAGEPQIEPGLYYQPAYSATTASLVAAKVTLSLSATSGAPGSTLTVSGSGYVPGDTVTLTFTDKAGVKTTLATPTVGSGGEYSTEVTLPAGAAVGTGTIKASATHYGSNLFANFKVT